MARKPGWWERQYEASRAERAAIEASIIDAECGIPDCVSCAALLEAKRAGGWIATLKERAG